MKNKNLLFTLFASFFIVFTASAQMPETDSGKIKKILPPVQKFYVATALDGPIFSSATIQENSGSTVKNKTGTIRFSDVINYGFTFNFNIGRHLGIYTGIDVKNIGFIEKDASANTVKRRTYNLGVPVGIKIGNMVTAKPYLLLGGGVDAPFNYREKTFVIRDQKTKFSEWFSSRTPATMPYVFAGASVYRGVTVKAQYYPGNFLNPEFTASNGTKPYAGYEVHLILLSLGFPVQISKHHDIVKQQVTGLNIM